MKTSQDVPVVSFPQYVIFATEVGVEEANDKCTLRIGMEGTIYSV
jgi:hypothetical protein